MNLDRRIVIEKCTLSKGGFGQDELIWNTQFSLWARRIDIQNFQKENIVDDSVEVSSQTTNFLIRYNRDVMNQVAIGIQTNNRLLDEHGRYYDIENISEQTDNKNQVFRNQYLILKCKMRGEQ
jgi:head-tail adaptor